MKIRLFWQEQPEKIMEHKKKIVHDFDFIGRILEILKILQEETDEYTQQFLKLRFWD